MSSNKRLCLRSHSLKRQQIIERKYRRDSFEDRVCDDLCEVILQFLPLKDKLKLECVSKTVPEDYLQLSMFTISGNTTKRSQKQKIEAIIKKYPKLK